jgi:1-acyl-sn-glycerol-3-phosphate acyltransferase
MARPLISVPLHLAGWKVDTDKPTPKKYVCLAFPHTSNWDGLLLLLLTQSIGMSMSWMIKSEWTRGPMGVVLNRLGAVGIERSSSHNIVQSMIEKLKSADELVLVIPPEGTRKRAEYWKSGFYHIARGANVPVVPAYLDYANKRGGFGPPIDLTGDVKADMDKIRAFYESVRAEGKVPASVGPMRLKDEEKSAS